MEYWSKDEDIINDMLELSDFCKAPEPAQPPSDFMKKLRGKPSIFDDEPVDEEAHQEQQYLPVRGHPLLKNGLRKPGGQPLFNQQQTSALIRKVSGFGYGNEMIEHAFKASNSEDEKDPEKLKKLAFDSSSRKSIKKCDEESDSSTSTSSEYISYSSRSNSSGCIKGPDIYSEIEFPNLK